MPRKRKSSQKRSKKNKKSRERTRKKSKLGKKPYRDEKDRKRKSKRDRKEEKRGSGSRNKRDRRRSSEKKRHPDMTSAAMKEDLGNIVLVKNRLATAHDSGTNTLGTEPKTAPVPSNRGTAAQKSKTAGTKSLPVQKPASMQKPINAAQKCEDYPIASSPYSRDIKMVPLGGNAMLPSHPPSTSATTGPGTSTVGSEPTTSTGHGTTANGTATDHHTTNGTSITPDASRSSGVAIENVDDVTKKDVGHHSDKSVCDKSQKWRMYMEKTMESGTDGMQLDFRIIRGYLPPAATRTAFDANMEKNRFEDVVCIDQSRVRLSNGNYIHASWVNIGVNKKAILTQLPVRESIAEFWLMILEMDVEGILLILTHSEFNMFNANWVFPAEQDFLHFKGVHIRVGEFKRVTIDREWTMHVISVRSGDCKRYVHMHHYSGWTHGKQPIRILDLWQIQSTFRKYRSPHVYMSLSGCGRAGTYAAFEIAHERLHWDGCNKLNINECIYRARNGRMHAVQRPIQLQTIHACIMEHIMATKFASQLPQRTVGKYEEFSSRFNKCAELQEDMA